MSRRIWFAVIVITGLVGGGWGGAVFAQDPSAAPSDPPAEKATQEEGAKPAEGANQEEGDKPKQEGAEHEKGDGSQDLEKAIELKSKAKTTRELDEVVELCESAIAKGLDDESKKLAEAMIKSTLFDHAKQLSTRIFDGPRDSRWRFLRREAISRLERVLKIDPQLVEAHLMVARLAMLPGGDLTEARQALDKAIEFAANDKPSLSEALLLRAALADDDDGRLADLNQAIIIDPNNTKALLSRGQYHHDKEDYAAATADFRTAIEQGSEDPTILALLLESLIADEQFDEANAEIEKALAKDANNPVYYRLRAQVRLSQEKPDEALADVNKVLELDPKNLESMLLKTSILYDQKRYDEALVVADEVLTVQPGLVRGILMRSLIHAGKEDYDKAIEDVKELVEFAPNNDGFQLQLALFYNAAKQTDEAIKIYNSILEDDPENSGAIRGRGDAYLAIGEHAKAIQDYEQVIEIQKDEPDAGTINNLAWVLATSPKPEIRDGKRSLELGLRACELVEYKESYAVSTLAAGYAEIGDFEKAREWAAKAVELGEQEKSDSLDNLRRELEGYQRNKPWRELLSEGMAGPEGEETRKEDQKQDAEKVDESAAPEKDADKTPDQPEKDKDDKSGGG